MVQDVEDFLKNLYPFSSLPPSSLQNLLEYITIKYYGRGEEIFEAGGEPLEYLYIIRKGSVLLRVDNTEVDLLKEGDIFGYLSLLTGNPPSVTAAAETDVILYLIPKGIFLKLVEKYPEFRNFFTSSLAERISHTLRVVKSKKEISGFEKFLTLKVKDLKIRSVPFVSSNESVLNLSKEMVKVNSSCVIVLNGEEGIITERDVIKKVIARDKNPKEVLAKDIMSSPIISVDLENFIFDVLILMAKHNIRRVVVKKGEEIIGILEDKDIVALETRSVIFLVKEIEKSTSIDELSYLYKLTKELAITLHKEGVRADYISSIISELNDKFLGKAVRLAIKEIGLEPIVPYSLLALGSEGRMEQTLKTDQDNALIYDDTYPSLDIDIRDYFKRLGEKISEILIRIGFPPCPAGVMVKNPEWNKGKSEWFRTLESWILKPEPEHTLKAGIFFDFRNTFGDKTLEEELREWVFKLVERNELFIAYMLMDAVRFKPPIGLFGRLKSEEKGVDLKRGGIFPITQGIRALSLKYKVKETNTLKRMEELKEKGVLYEELYRNLREAFILLQEIRLKAQIDKLERGEELDNYVNPSHLSKIERDLLKDAFKVVEEFQDFIDNRYLSYIPR